MYSAKKNLVVTYTKCSSKAVKQISNKFYKAAITVIKGFLVSFAGIALKLEKVGPTFSSFNPRPSLPSFVTDGRKQLQYLNIVLNNKTGPLFHFLKFN